MNLLKSLAAVSSMTMFSRVLGFARDAIVARVFGAGMATDAFFVAFKLPNLLRRIFAEGAFSQAFVPILAEYKSKQGEDATRVFVSYVSGLLTLALAVVTVLGMLAAPWVIMVTAPGFADTADKFALTSQLLRITFPYILLISLASLVGAILNTWNRFSVPAFAPRRARRPAANRVLSRSILSEQAPPCVTFSSSFSPLLRLPSRGGRAAGACCSWRISCRT